MNSIKSRLFFFTFINFTLSYFISAIAITLFVVICSHGKLLSEGAYPGALSYVFNMLFTKWFFLLCFPFLLYLTERLNILSQFVLQNRFISLLTFTWTPLIFILRAVYLIIPSTNSITLYTFMLYLPLFIFLLLQIISGIWFRKKLIEGA